MSKRILSTMLFLIAPFMSLQATEITSASTPHEMRPQLFDNLTPNTLVLFDLDYVLIAPKDAILRPCGEINNLRKKQFDRIKEATNQKTRIMSDAEVPEFDFFLSIIIQNMNSECVDAALSPIVKEVQDLNIPIIALSHSQPRRLGLVKDYIISKSESLKRLGVNLDNKHFNPSSPIEMIGKHHPAYDKGLLFTDGAKKGPTLMAFLKSQNYTPSRVIFVDDRLKMLLSVGEACDEIGIPFHGIHYEQLFKKGEVVDEEVGVFQFTHLLKNEVWLNDQQARDYLSIKKEV
jgi:hypothetical protein